jgi:hypothetical protein
VAVGPGLPIPEPADLYDDGSGERESQARYVPLQAQEGDYVLFMRKSAVEITFEKQQYLIVPNAAILVLVREDWDPQEDWGDDSVGDDAAGGAAAEDPEG